MPPSTINTTPHEEDAVRAQTICAVFVTYKPRAEFIDNIVNVAPHVDHVVVVDNGSSTETEQRLREFGMRSGCTVIRNVENLGIARALNLGVKYALESEYDWVCTFDQDSQVSDGFISKMLDTYQQAPDPKSVAIIAPS